MRISAKNSWRFILCLVIVVISGCSSLPKSQHQIVDGYSMEYTLAGNGKSVVVLESGFAASMENWDDVFGEISKFSRVFAYNRRGYGQSLPQDEANHDSDIVSAAKFVGGIALDAVAPGVTTAVDVIKTADYITNEKNTNNTKVVIRTASEVVGEQRKLLKAAGLEPPYILVGHSLGGLYNLYFAKTYPEEVEGLILVDSTHPNQMKVCKELDEENCGLPWLLKKILPDNMTAEIKGMEITGEQVLKAPSLGDLPLIVISRGDKAVGGAEYLDKMWPTFQADLATQSTNSSLIIAKKSGHFIQSDEPSLVIDSVRKMVQLVENKSQD